MKFFKRKDKDLIVDLEKYVEEVESRGIKPHRIWYASGTHSSKVGRYLEEKEGEFEKHLKGEWGRSDEDFLKESDIHIKAMLTKAENDNMHLLKEMLEKHCPLTEKLCSANCVHLEMGCATVDKSAISSSTYSTMIGYKNCIDVKKPSCKLWDKKYLRKFLSYFKGVS